MKIFTRTSGYPVLTAKEMNKILKEMKVKTFDEELRQLKLATKCNENEHHQDGGKKIMPNYRPNGRRRLGRS
jgi:hypothetical protein